MSLDSLWMASMNQDGHGRVSCRKPRENQYKEYLCPNCGLLRTRNQRYCQCPQCGAPVKKVRTKSNNQIQPTPKAGG